MTATAHCLTPGCRRERIPTSPAGAVHAHCSRCEARLLREVFGPVSWHDRAAVGELPASVVGGSLLDFPTLRDGDSPAVPQGTNSTRHRDHPRSRRGVGLFPQASVPSSPQVAAPAATAGLTPD